MDSVKNKIVWVVGGTSGLGEQMVRDLLDQGAKVIASGRNFQDKDYTNSSSYKYLKLDLADTDSISQSVKEVVTIFGQVDILVHSAAITQQSRTLTTLPEVEEKIFQINFFNIVKLTRLMIPYFIEQEKGSIVVISDLSVFFNKIGKAAYTASKAALTCYFGCLTNELEQYNIAINLFLLGDLETDFNNKALNGEGKIVSLKKDPLGLPLPKTSQKIIKAILKNKRSFIISDQKELLSLKLSYLFK